MPIDFITAQLQAFKEKSTAGKQIVEDLCRESPLERTRRNIQNEIAKNEKYRASILQNVNTFGKNLLMLLFKRQR